ncbi:MAG: mechanosensitive ion channel [Candidatus Aenigmarchaeota archaeon]|nr:mechanosensitive ion channel [Candidatus Aenigmarchaeota archaeon]NIP40537.1 mechanosensitive ion channel [Candidatus Aenigmarchaeota archaeon]NIQ18382.1 mechanosensitive ion channel [Candidatus Aenigmarchaeota archaeon]
MINVEVINQLLQNEWVVKIIWVIITLVAAKIAIKLFSPIVRKFDDMVDRVEWSEQKHKMVERVIKYGIWIAAILVILEILGLKGAIFTALAGMGVAGIAVGFAAKDTLSNFISGIFLYSDKMFNIGDTVEIDGKVGKVMDIHLRNTVIKGFDNKIMIIPNSKTASSLVINYSRLPTRRLSIPVGIAYEADLKKAEKLILDIIKKDPDFLDEPKPSVIVKGFGDFSVDLEARGWIKNKGFLDKKVRLTKEIKIAFDKNDIEIPYPKRVMISPKRPAGKRKK